MCHALKKPIVFLVKSPQQRVGICDEADDLSLTYQQRHEEPVLMIVVMHVPSNSWYLIDYWQIFAMVVVIHFPMISTTFYNIAISIADCIVVLVPFFQCWDGPFVSGSSRVAARCSGLPGGPAGLRGVAKHGEFGAAKRREWMGMGWWWKVVIGSFPHSPRFAPVSWKDVSLLHGMDVVFWGWQAEHQLIHSTLHLGRRWWGMGQTQENRYDQ